MYKYVYNNKNNKNYLNNLNGAIYLFAEERWLYQSTEFMKVPLCGPWSGSVKAILL